MQSSSGHCRLALLLAWLTAAAAQQGGVEIKKREKYITVKRDPVLLQICMNNKCDLTVKRSPGGLFGSVSRRASGVV